MKTGAFMTLIADNYDDVIKLFKSLSRKTCIDFDEDSFQEAFLKCAKKFGSEQITYDEATKYFWAAYLNTAKSELVHDNKFSYIDSEEIKDEIIDETDDDYSDLYIDVMNAIQKKFGKEDSQIYILYKYHDWTEDDLIATGYDCENFTERIKKIHRFVKSYKKYL
jgi:hypothetical protein